MKDDYNDALVMLSTYQANHPFVHIPDCECHSSQPGSELLSNKDITVSFQQYGR